MISESNMINFFYLSTTKAKKIYSIYCFISINMFKLF